MKTRLTTLLLLAASLFSAGPAGAQDTKSSPELTGFWLTTTYPDLSLKPGETGSVPLSLRNAGLPPQRASIEVTGIPDGWKWSLKGGGREIRAVMVGPGETERINLEITPPPSASGDGIQLQVNARRDAETNTLPLQVRLSSAVTGGLKLEPELPALRGTARSTFSFKIKATNERTEQGLFNLFAEVPEGFQTKFKRGYGSEEITSVPIAAGSSENITLEVIPPRTAPAGRYPVALRVGAGDNLATTTLSMELTGEPSLRIVGPQERLSGEATAGQESNFTFTLTNTGSAPATDLELASTPPNGWTVTFEPKQIAALGPNQSREVAVKIRPSERAVAGDYMVTVRASGGPLSEQVQFRTTVQTSTLWGAAGLGVIAISVLVLGAAVLRYGRR